MKCMSTIILLQGAFLQLLSFIQKVFFLYKLVDLTIVNLVLGYHLVLLKVCEEPAVFATLKSTVVRLHMASLPGFHQNKIFSSYMFLHFCLVCHNFLLIWGCYLVGYIPPRPITMLCHIRPVNHCQIAFSNNSL